MKRQPYHQWVRVSLLGAMVSTSMALAPTVANAQSLVEQQTEMTQTTQTPALGSTMATTPSNVDPVQPADSTQGLTVVQEATPTLPKPGVQAVQLQEAAQHPSSVLPAEPQLTQAEVKTQDEAATPQPTKATVQTKEEIATPQPAKTNVKTTQDQTVTPEPTATEMPATPTPSGISILTPSQGSVINKPATTVIIEFSLDQQVELRVNDRVIDKAQIGRTERNSATKRVRQIWYGVILESGTNRISVQEVGKAQPATTIQVEVPGQPTRLKVRTAESMIPADGRSTAQVSGQLLDEQGNQSNWDAVVTLEATEGKFVGTDQKPDIPGFQVEAIDGQFQASLQSGIQAGLVRIRASSGELEGFHQFQFATPVRPSPLLTGVVDVRVGRRGTNFTIASGSFCL